MSGRRYTVAQLAEILGIAKSTCYWRLHRQGCMPGKDRLFSEQDLKRICSWDDKGMGKTGRPFGTKNKKRSS